MSADQATFVIRLQPQPGIDPAMRWLLKAALRQYGLRCVEVREEPPAHEKIPIVENRKHG
jgi:hypothetical protein